MRSVAPRAELRGFRDLRRAGRRRRATTAVGWRRGRRVRHGPASHDLPLIAGTAPIVVDSRARRLAPSSRAVGVVAASGVASVHREALAGAGEAVGETATIVDAMEARDAGWVVDAVAVVACLAGADALEV